MGGVNAETIDSALDVRDCCVLRNRSGVLAHGLDCQHAALVDILDELGHIVGLRAHEDVLGRADLMDCAIFHDADPRTHA